MATQNSINAPFPFTVAQGGTGLATLTSHGILIGNGTGPVTVTAEPTDGQLLIGKTGFAPVLASLTADANITITPGAGTIEIAATAATTGGGYNWTNVTGTTQAMAAGGGYIANNAGLVTLTLPATAAVGDSFRITGFGAGGWLMAQNASQLVHFGNLVTTTGTGGSLASTNQFDGIELVSVVTNTTFNIISAIGNITIV